MAERFCKYKQQHVVVSEYNLDCRCCGCEMQVRCNCFTCPEYAAFTLQRDIAEEHKKRCRGCLRMTKSRQAQR